MILILKPNPDPQALKALTQHLTDLGLTVQPSGDRDRTLLVLSGDCARLDIDRLRCLDLVEDVKRVQSPFPLADRRSHPEDTVISLGSVRIGGGEPQIIAGPCAVESEEQICEIARSVKAAGATLLRGGAFKPRTSPYSFSGLGPEGLRLLAEAKRQTGLPIVTELMDLSQLPLFEEVDVIQVGARNMRNYVMLKALGALRKPILLKRDLSATLEELLLSAEHILAGGNSQVILCERGIRTFDDYTRNTLDLAAVSMLRELTHLPIIVDPSHATGIARLVPPMALAATACGADGLIIEVHNDPMNALCDGAQSLTPEQFGTLMKKIRAIREVVTA